MDMADANAGIDRSLRHLAGLCRGFAIKRGNTQGGDAVARFAQHLKAETVKREALSGFRDRTGFMNDKTGNGGRFVVGNVPIHRAIEIANGDAAIDID